MPARRISPGRRHLSAALLLGGTSLLTSTPAPARVIGAAAPTPLAPTPRGPLGPFYPPAFAADPTDSLLLDQAMGQPVRLAGRILDAQGRAQNGARIEIWQCDATGRYHHPRDRSPNDRDPGFAGFGWQSADANGAYGFTTIRPVPYPGRTPHIHVAVITPAQQRQVLQIYLPDEAARNEADFIYSRMGERARHALATPDGGTLRFDVVLG